MITPKVSVYDHKIYADKQEEFFICDTVAWGFRVSFPMRLKMDSLRASGKKQD